MRLQVARIRVFERGSLEICAPAHLAPGRCQQRLSLGRDRWMRCASRGVILSQAQNARRHPSGVKDRSVPLRSGALPLPSPSALAQEIRNARQRPGDGHAGAREHVEQHWIKVVHDHFPKFRSSNRSGLEVRFRTWNHSTTALQFGSQWLCRFKMNVDLGQNLVEREGSAVPGFPSALQLPTTSGHTPSITGLRSAPRTDRFRPNNQTQSKEITP